MNDTQNVTDPPASSGWWITTGIIGVIGALENAFILLIHFCNSRLLRSSSLLVSLTIAHFLNGIIHAVFGFWPKSYTNSMVRRIFCIQVVWPSLFLVMYLLLPVLLALNGTERLLAVAAPVWYRNTCTNRRLWIVSGIAFSTGVISLISIWLIAGIGGDALVPGSCIPPYLVGPTYTIYGAHFPAVVGGTAAFVCTAIAVSIGRRRIKKMAVTSKREMDRAKKHARLAKCLLLMSCFDMVFVVIPNMLLILANVGTLHIPLQYAIYPVMAYCMDSALNIIAFLLFNTDFRKVLLKLLPCWTVSVEPTSSAADATSRTRKY